VRGDVVWLGGGAFGDALGQEMAEGVVGGVEQFRERQVDSAMCRGTP
jgi:hypothetical protein